MSNYNGVYRCSRVWSMGPICLKESCHGHPFHQRPNGRTIIPQPASIIREKPTENHPRPRDIVYNLIIRVNAIQSYIKRQHFKQSKITAVLQKNSSSYLDGQFLFLLADMIFEYVNSMENLCLKYL
jgi:hypothetical protein